MLLYTKPNHFMIDNKFSRNITKTTKENCPPNRGIVHENTIQMKNRTETKPNQITAMTAN